MKKAVISGILALSLVAGCQQGQNTSITKSDVGTVLGGAAGAWAGSAIGGGSGKAVAIAAGTLLGSVLGRSVGGSLDKVDLQHYNTASQRALETGQPGQSFPWQNPNSNVNGVVTPSSYYQNSAGSYCREYVQTITIGGRIEEGHGVACRQPDGSWKIQS